MDSSNPDTRIEIVRSPDAFAALEDEWRDLCRRDPGHLFWQTYDVAKCAWEHVGAPRGRRLAIVVIREGGRAVLIWPLVVCRRYLWRQAHWLGAEASEYCDGLVERGPNADRWLRIADRAARDRLSADFLYGSCIRDDAAFRPLFERDDAVRVRDDSAPFLLLSEHEVLDPCFPLAGKKSRRTLRQSLRRLEKRGAVVLGPARGHDEIVEAADWIVSAKRDWLDRAERFNPWLKTPEFPGYFRTLALAAERREKLLCIVLKIDGQIIAAGLGFAHGGTLEFLIYAYDPEWSSYSPGGLVRQRFHQGALELGMDVVDYRIGSSPEKDRFATGAVDLIGQVQPYSRWGAFYLRRLRRPLRRSSRQLPPRIRRIIEGG